MSLMNKMSVRNTLKYNQSINQSTIQSINQSIIALIKSMETELSVSMDLIKAIGPCNYNNSPSLCLNIAMELQLYAPIVLAIHPLMVTSAFDVEASP